jgi:hypothetical protein
MKIEVRMTCFKQMMSDAQVDVGVVRRQDPKPIIDDTAKSEIDAECN